MKRVGVDLVGSPESLLRAFRKSAEGADYLKLNLRQLGEAATKSAVMQTQAAVKRDARLRQEIAMYREVARTAVRGSREQVAAANLATQTQKHLANSMGITARESRHLASSVERAERGFSHLGRGALAGSGAIRGMGRSLAFASAGFLSAAGTVTLLRGAVGAASDLVEETNKANIVFRGSERQVMSWSKNLNAAFGMTRAEALHTAATFGNMLVPMGFARQDAARMSEGLVTLAGDMASFNNTTSADTLSAIQSGLAGMVRPLRPLGVFLTQDRIKAEALSAGLVKASVDVGKVADANNAVTVAQARLTAANAKYGEGSVQSATASKQLSTAQRQLKSSLGGVVLNLTSAQKAGAAYRIILKDTADAHGDASRTGKAFAGQMRQLHANIGNLQEGIGGALLPDVIKVTAAMNKWLSSSKNQARVQRDVKEAVHDVGVAVHVAKEAFDLAAPPIRTLTGAVGGLKHMLELLTAAAVAWKLRGAVALVTGFRNAEYAAGGRGAAGAIGKLRGEASKLAKIGTLSLAFRFPGLASGLSRLGTFAALASKLAGIGTIDLTLLYKMKGDQGPGPPSDPHLGQGVGATFPLLEKLGSSNTGFKGAPRLLAEYTAYRKGLITAQQTETWLRANAKTLLKLGVASQGDVERSSTLASTRMFPPGTPSGGPALPGGAPAASAQTPADKAVARAATRQARVKPLTAAQLLTVGLSESPNKISLLRQQSANQQKAIDQLKTARAAGKIGNAAYVAQITLLNNDLRATNDQIASIETTARAKLAAAAKRAATKAQRAILATLKTKETTLRTALKTSGDSKKADLKLIAFLRGEAHDPRLAPLGKAVFAGKIATELKREADIVKRDQAKIAALIASVDRENARLMAHLSPLATAKAQAGAMASAQTVIQRQQFVALGLTPAGKTKAPPRATLKEQLAHVKLGIKGTPFATKANETELAAITKLMGSQWATLTEKTKQWIRTWLDARDKELKKNRGFGPAGLASAASLTAGISDPTERRHVRAGVAQALGHFGHIPTGAGVQGVAIPGGGSHSQPLVVHTHISLDGREIANVVTTHQQRTNGNRATQTSGINAGRAI